MELSNTPSTRSSTDDATATSVPTVIKLGGSLLDLEDVIDRLAAAVDDLTLPLVVVGGGSAADLVRQWDRLDQLTDRDAHQLAIAAMSFNAHTLAQSDHRLAFVSSRAAAADAVHKGRIPLLDAVAVLATEERQQPGLPTIPASWDVTSDSIAAWLARAWEGRLRLLKSVDPQSGALDVDAWFPTAAQGLMHIDWVNLRRTPAVAIPVTVTEEAAVAGRRLN